MYTHRGKDAIIMANGKIIQRNDELLNAAVYIDFDNIFELLKRYQADPFQINFFPLIIQKLKNEYGLNIIDCVAYANFERLPLRERHQTVLHNMGVDTRHTANNGKNCADLMLTVEALSNLYKNPSIDVFVIISSDRDMIPLLKTIKKEYKQTCMFSTKYGFNASVTCFADTHEYLEDMFNLTPDMILKTIDAVEVYVVEEKKLNDRDVEKAKEVSKLHISAQTGQGFRVKLDTNSGGNWTLIPG